MIELQRAALALCVIATLAPVASGQDFYLKTGDNVIFYGDSDLPGRLYEGFIESYVVTRYPQRDVLFAHAIWNQPADPASRPDRPAVIVTKPPIGDAKEPASASYQNSHRNILASFPHARLTTLQMGPAPVDRVPAIPEKEGALQVHVGGLIGAAVDQARAIDPALVVDWFGKQEWFLIENADRSSAP